MTTSAPLLGEPLPVELINTVWADRDGVHDALASARELAQWLVSISQRLDVPVDSGLDPAPPPGLTRTWTITRDLRDALRRLAADATHDSRPAAASACKETERARLTLNAAATHAPRWSALVLPATGAPKRVIRTDASAPDAAVSQIADEAIALFGGEARSALRACLAPGCVLYFVKQHPRREWCSPGCGNRARVARHYARHNAARA